MTEHKLKTRPEYFNAVISGEKKFELRKNDRNYQIGDSFTLMEWSIANGYTGRQYSGRIKYVLKDYPQYGLADGYCIFAGR